MLRKEIASAIIQEINVKRGKYGHFFLLSSDEGRYKGKFDNLKSSTNLDQDEYPETLTEAFDLLVR